MNVERNADGMYAVTVNGCAYAFEKWGAEDALDTLLDISAIAGGPVGSAIAMAISQGGNAEITKDMTATIFDSFAGNLRSNKEAVKTILRKMAGRNVLCDGKKVDYDKHYSENLGLMFQVARACFEVQYGRFFADALANVGFRRGQKLADTTQAQATSNGPSGA